MNRNMNCITCGQPLDLEERLEELEKKYREVRHQLDEALLQQMETGND